MLTFFPSATLNSIVIQSPFSLLKKMILNSNGISLFSFTSWRDWWLQLYFTYCGMTSHLIQLDQHTHMHIWTPTKISPHKESLVLIHGFGANAKWQWHHQISPLMSNFNIFIPDLVFFGKSFSTGSQRTEIFQAESVMKVMEHVGVRRFHVCGMSYGGFVAYRMAHLFPEAVEKAVIVSSNVCMVPEDTNELLRTNDSKTATDILLPQTAEDMRILMEFSLFRAPRFAPSFILQDFINTMYTKQREEKVELLQKITLGKDGEPPLPVLTQETLILWGDHDLVFPLDMGYRLKRHLGDTAKLVVIKDTGHAAGLENPDEFNKFITAFLLNSSV